MTPMQITELRALRHCNDTLGKPSAIHKSHWHDGVRYAEICAAGYAKRYARQPKGFSKDFFGVKITDAGRDFLDSLLVRVWIMKTADGFYPIQASEKCKPEDHGELNPHVLSIEDISGRVLWSRPEPVNSGDL